LTSLLSIILPFVVWKVGLAGLLFSIVGQRLAYKFGDEMQTLGELARRISRENYSQATRHSSTINKQKFR
jgi:hypothetical protein